MAITRGKQDTLQRIEGLTECVQRLVFWLTVMFWIGQSAFAQTNGDPKTSSNTIGNLSPAELAKEIHNPIGTLREVIFQLDILPNVGSDNKTQLVNTIQTVWPFDIGKDWKLVTYSIIPLVSQPGLASGDDRTYGLGDSNFFGYFAPATEGKVIWGIGPALQAPTATDNDLGRDKWAAGPALILGIQPGNWSIFGLFDNVWSFAGSGDEKVNEFTFQYQAVYQFPKDWFFITNWVVDADWEAANGDRWTVPIGGGFGKQFKLGSQQFQVYGQVGYNVVKPDDASGWRAITVLSLIF
jgi:hypothetical protein